MSDSIKKLTIEGFKSIKKLANFELRSLNVLIGANGTGKSNFLEFFRLLRELVEQRLQVTIEIGGGADAYLYLGPKVTKSIVARLHFQGNYGYELVFVPTDDGRRLIFSLEEVVVFVEENTKLRAPLPRTISLGSGHTEARLKDSLRDDWGGWRQAQAARSPVPYQIRASVSSWIVYHFHDTSTTAAVRRQGAINDNESLRPNAENLAAFLYRISQTHPGNYGRIRDVVRLAAPFFDDFRLRPIPTSPEMIQLEWMQKDSDYPFRASQLSDGTLRFICMATALLQPAVPVTTFFDEPELGLHPYALTLLADLFQQAAVSRQLIVSTQSAPLLNEFAPEEVIIVERTQGESTFRRLDSAQLSEWLQEYSLGELWQKNVLGGRPRSDATPPSDGDSIVVQDDGGPRSGETSS